MKKLFTLILAVACFTSSAQTEYPYPYNPDFENDGFVGIEDVLELLSVYGTPFTPEQLLLDGASLTEIIESLQEQIDSLASYTNEGFGAIALNDSLLTEYLVGVAAASEEGDSTLGAWVMQLSEVVEQQQAQLDSIQSGFINLDSLSLTLEGDTLRLLPTDSFVLLETTDQSLSGFTLESWGSDDIELEGCFDLILLNDQTPSIKRFVGLKDSAIFFIDENDALVKAWGDSGYQIINPYPYGPSFDYEQGGYSNQTFFSGICGDLYVTFGAGGNGSTMHFTNVNTGQYWTHDWGAGGRFYAQGGCGLYTSNQYPWLATCAYSGGRVWYNIETLEYFTNDVEPYQRLISQFEIGWMSGDAFETHDLETGEVTSFPLVLSAGDYQEELWTIEGDSLTVLRKKNSVTLEIDQFVLPSSIPVYESTIVRLSGTISIPTFVDSDYHSVRFGSGDYVQDGQQLVKISGPTSWDCFQNVWSNLCRPLGAGEILPNGILIEDPLSFSQRELLGLTKSFAIYND